MHEEVGPGAGQRYRCDGCGNLTRFDIETVERVRRYWHADLSGQGEVESEERLETHAEEITCRWCGTGARVRVIEAPVAQALAKAGS